MSSDRPTHMPCPVCNGNGLVGVGENASSYRGVKCPCCDGKKTVSADDLRRYRESQKKG